MFSFESMLTDLIALPFIGAILIAAMGPRAKSAIRWTAFAVTLAGFALACLVTIRFLEIRAAAPPIAEIYKPELVPGPWNLIEFGNLGAIQFYIGVDGLNVWLMLLTAFLMIPAVLVSWNAIDERVNEYYAWLLALGASMMGVFLAFDLILFYVFFELTLVPLFFLIGIWGGPERRHAARKFFIYTLTGSVITFLGLLAVVVAVYTKTNQWTFAIPELVAAVTQQIRTGDQSFWGPFQVWVFIALCIGFAIKVPLFPTHTWLPLAHVEAPTAGSVLLAGVLLKMGTYGFMRLCLPVVPDACIQIGVPLIGTLSVIGIIYGALCCLAQDDIKKLIAYSSVSHLGFCMLGMFALNTAGLSGSLLQMINHGLSTGALFLIVGMLYERYHTRKMADYSGIGSKLGLLTFAMVFTCLSSAGLPGLNGFVGEAFVFFGMIQVRPVFAIAATAGILLGAWYLLSMLKNVFFGKLKEPHLEGHGEVHDLNGREIITLAPILVLCVYLGVQPNVLLKSSKPEIEALAKILADRSAALEHSGKVARK
jgi:NADH-quinone oxidoreductase subunit M